MLLKLCTVNYNTHSDLIISHRYWRKKYGFLLRPLSRDEKN